MIELSRNDVRERLPWSALVEAIDRKLRAGDLVEPQRLAFDLDGGGADDGTLLVMLSWQGREVIGIKTVTFWPDNHVRDLPSHGANYILMDARSGSIMAILDGEELTGRRTAAVSVLAASRLLRRDAHSLLVCGTGPIAENLVRAHHASGRFTSIRLYGRTRSRAEILQERLAEAGIACTVCSDDLRREFGDADMISTATSATSPLFDGSWVSAGSHVDLVGSFRPIMREVDDHLLRRASSIWIDTPTALKESGDLTQPIAAGVISLSDIRGDLRALVLGGGRRSDDEITIFKAVGFALPDLAAAEAALGGIPETLMKKAV